MSIFNYENGFMQTLGRICDCICLDLMWFVCCIPIITIGASSSAYYYAYNKVIRQRRSYVFKEFFHGFKINFKQGTLNWLMVLGLYLFLLLDCRILTLFSKEIKGSNVLLVIIIALIVFLTMWMLYLFPYMARFENTGKMIRKNCAIIMVANAPWTFLLLLIFVVTVAGVLLLPMLGIFIPIFYVALSNLILERIFRKYMLPEDLANEKEIEMHR